MNGAESLVRALTDAGVDVCFANPGTSEMHFVAALDRIGGIRCVLGLFEGVVTGAADGYARMAGRPAATLLHTGPGLANGIANLHNARKARVPVVNVVGEHALWHIEHDAPLTADIEGLAAPVSHWVRTATSATALGADGRDAVAAARVAPGRIATLVVPANVAWEAADGDGVAPARAAASEGISEGPSSGIDPVVRGHVGAERIEAVARALEGDEPAVLVLGGEALLEGALESAGRIAAASGATLVCETFKTRMERGPGRVSVPDVPYRVADAVELLAPFGHVVTVGAKPPVAFFAYPDTPSELYPESARVHALAEPGEDVAAALDALARRLGAGDATPAVQAPSRPDRPADGPLDPDNLAAVVARLLPEEAIVVDESITAGRGVFAATRGAARHDWLEVCGGSIGGGLPLATGAAIAAPDRPVLCLEGDGSAMYTVQSLWTQARESLDVTTVVLANGGYEILKHELGNVRAGDGAAAGRVALDMMELDRPELDWVAMARSMGVEAVRAGTVAELEAALERAFATSGPFLVEARL